jgi:hypothetical protein
MNRSELHGKATEAVKHFWQVREAQGAKQGQATGQRDAGSRTAVTGGKQLDGFAELVSQILIDAGLPEHNIHRKRGGVAVPGYFRPTKEWDLLAVVDGRLLATVEFKSQVGPSFGNNYNNRTEEALGSATDLWTAYREGAFPHAVKPWIGYFMLLEDSEASTKPVRAPEPHFSVFEEFREASYKRRYELFCQRLIRERLYNGVCFVTSRRDAGQHGHFHEPREELNLWQFAASLEAHARAYAKLANE